MKSLPMLVIMFCLCCLPAPVQGGSNQVDLEGKGQSHIESRGANPLREGRKVEDSLRAQQGRKALADVKKQQSKNQADMKKAMDNMNKVKAPKPARQNLN